jgi:hypothetical protein
MKNLVNEVYQMGIVLKKWIKINLTKLTTRPHAKELLDLISDEHAEIEVNMEIQQRDLQSYTLGKDLRRKKMIKHLFACCTFLHNDALKKVNTELASRLKLSIAKLNKMSYTALLAKAKEIYDLCTERGESLGETGISPELFANLEQSINESTEYLTVPKEMRDNRKLATLKMNQSARRIQSLITQRLTPIMSTCFPDDPIFLEEYQNAVTVQKAPTHKLAIQGQIRNAETGDPLTNTWLEVPGTDIAYRATGKTGLFRIQHLEPGNYQLTCTHGNYHPLTVDFTQVWGETNKLNLELQMTEKAKAEKKLREEEERAKRRKQKAITSVN